MCLRRFSQSNGLSFVFVYMCVFVLQVFIPIYRGLERRWELAVTSTCLAWSFVSYPNFWPKMSLTRAVRLYIHTPFDSDFQWKIRQRGILKYLILVPSRALFSQFAFFNFSFHLLFKFFLNSFFKSLSFIIWSLFIFILMSKKLSNPAQHRLSTQAVIPHLHPNPLFCSPPTNPNPILSHYK